MNEAFDEELRALYAERGVVGPQGQLPFVGARYERGGLVILSKALRGEGHGPSGLRADGLSAHQTLSAGAGGGAWTEAATLAAVWLEAGGVELPRNGSMYGFDGLAQALEQVAVVPSIKWASAPVAQDESTGGAGQVLFPELGVLQPNRLLVIGGRDAARTLRRGMPARLCASAHASVRAGRRQSKLVVERRWHPDLAKVDLLVVSRGKVTQTAPVLRTLLTRWSSQRGVR